MAASFTRGISAAGPGQDTESERLRQCQERLGHTFTNMALLELALAHASGAAHRLASNARMEFLGDSVLNLLVCEFLYRELPDLLEGELTKLKSAMVSRSTCARVAARLNLIEFVSVGKALSDRPQVPLSVQAELVEAVLAAVYLDGGLEAARDVFDRHIRQELVAVRNGHTLANYKSELQHEASVRLDSQPVYCVEDERGPQHLRWFCVGVKLGPTSFPSAWGRSKKEAEQRAAANAMATLRGQAAPFSSQVPTP